MQQDCFVIENLHAINWIVLLVHPLIAVISAGHALLSKNDPRAAFGWIGVCLVFPIAGPILYYLFGINRVQTRARKLQKRFTFGFRVDHARTENHGSVVEAEREIPPEFRELARISDAVTGLPLLTGNRISILHNGEEAYPAMLRTIDNAKRYLYLSTYIFETNHTGRQFIAALAGAVKRNVEVRVLLDGFGEWYSVPRAGSLLKKKGVAVGRFLSPKLLPPTVHVNLRNHRKILVADGEIAYTGGMNIGDRHLVAGTDSPSRVVDAHFRIQGPVVRQIEEVFHEDWMFCAGQSIPHTAMKKEHGVDGAVCRAIMDGPNEDLGKLMTVMVGAVSAARHNVTIMTPYFLPDRELIAALQAAALRGVTVDVILPEKNNLPYVHWATRNMLWELLQWDVRVYYQPGPFVHTKLFIIDDQYAHVGSANVDPRSLRLNFELAIEVYDRDFVRQLAEHMSKVRNGSREVSLQEIDDRSLLISCRDALAWLFSPYL